MTLRLAKRIIAGAMLNQRRYSRGQMAGAVTAYLAMPGQDPWITFLARGLRARLVRSRLVRVSGDIDAIIVEFGRAAGVACFVKQVGALPCVDQHSDKGAFYALLKDPKGGNPEEWPEDLRVREWPKLTGGGER